jgi:hypothetical protein
MNLAQKFALPVVFVLSNDPAKGNAIRLVLKLLRKL